MGHRQSSVKYDCYYLAHLHSIHARAADWAEIKDMEL